MSILGTIRRFIRAIIRYQSEPAECHRGHAIARTIKHGTTVIGGNANASLGNIGHSERENMMMKTSQRYDDSLEETNGKDQPALGR